MWLDQPQPIVPSGSFQALGSHSMGMRVDQLSENDEDLIPTAIVIKNIPFAVKKEQLIQVMTDLCLPLPYAFNYHFDNGVFRGLAFANFTTPEETGTVINAMNHLDLHGRKLRVEYKKMLPQAERDRIEREKRERRGQLEEQHRPMATSQLQTQPSMSSLASHRPAASPSPVSARAAHASMFRLAYTFYLTDVHIDMDMNDPITLKYYSQLILFQAEGNTEFYVFPSTVPPQHRTIIHGLAHQLGLGHTSHGSGELRQIHIFRTPAGANGMTPTMTSNPNALSVRHRQLNRSATTDFTDVRGDPNFYGAGLGSTQSTGFLGFSDSQGGLSVGSNLRAAKSFADLRSYTPSPAQTAANFPAGLAGNIGRFSEYGSNSPGSMRDNITPIATTIPPGGNDALLVSGMNSMRLNGGFEPAAGSPHRLRGMMSWDREAPGPIGGHRTYSSNQEDQSRNRSQGAPTRQPRGTLPDRGNGFTRGRQNGHQTHGSDELSSPTGVETVVESF